jgi:hypothetical protein
MDYGEKCNVLPGSRFVRSKVAFLLCQSMGLVDL